MLTINNVDKFYSNGTKKLHVLKNNNMHVEEGEFVAIKGFSGAGKSTLLHVIGGLDKPDNGEVLFGDCSIYELKDASLAKLRNESFGFIFQFYHLLPEFTVIENVVLPGLISGKYKRKYLNKKAESLLESIGLEHKLDSKPYQISGGEQQRVAIARAMILEPRVLLCDEPTGNLDSNMTARICELLTHLHRSQKQTIILVTHQEDIASAAQKCVFIQDGKLVKQEV